MKCGRCNVEVDPDEHQSHVDIEVTARSHEWNETVISREEQVLCQTCTAEHMMFFAARYVPEVREHLCINGMIEDGPRRDCCDKEWTR